MDVGANQQYTPIISFKKKHDVDENSTGNKICKSKCGAR